MAGSPGAVYKLFVVRKIESVYITQFLNNLTKVILCLLNLIIKKLGLLFFSFHFTVTYFYCILQNIGLQQTSNEETSPSQQIV